MMRWLQGRHCFRAVPQPLQIRNALLLLGSLLLGVAAVPAADSTAKLEQRIDKFVASREKALEASHKRMLKAIKGVENEIRQSDLDADAKKLTLDRVRSDYERCQATKSLPSCDELVGVSIQYVEDLDKIQQEIESLRKSLLDQSIKTNDANKSKKLDELESRVASLLGDRVDFQQGDDWKGQSLGAKGGAFGLKLHLAEVSGTVFRGAFHKTASSGTTDIMKVEGTRDGHRFSMKTTQMIRGAKQSYEFHGYVLGPRIVAEYSGQNTKGKVAGGTIGLSKR